MPKGVSRPRPPALITPPGAVWQTAQSPNSAIWRPRAMVASDHVDAAGRAIASIGARRGHSVHASPIRLPTPPAASVVHSERFARLSLLPIVPFEAADSRVPPSAASTRSGVNGGA